MQLIQISLAVYFVFYLFNYTPMFQGIREKVSLQRNMWKAEGNLFYHVFYPILDCIFCLTFWVLLCSGYELTFVMAASVINLFVELWRKWLLKAQGRSV
jgi:hypothetical protein